jgi:hypothetical protein
MPNLRISQERARKLLNDIPHKKCQQGMKSHWKIENGRIKPQSVCWLYCWGKPNTSTRDAEETARHAFNEILDLSFDSFDRQLHNHEWARQARYYRNDANVYAKFMEHGIK